VTNKVVINFLMFPPVLRQPIDVEYDYNKHGLDWFHR